MSSITEVARLAGRVDRHGVARRLGGRLPGERRDPRARAGGRAHARLRAQRPRPRPAQEPGPGRRRDRPRHHRPVLRRDRPRRRGRGVARPATSSSPASSERDARARARQYVRLLRSMRAAAVIFAGSGLDDAALNEELQRHLDSMREVGRRGRPPLAARAGRARGRRRQRGRHRGDGRARWSGWATSGSRSSPARRRCSSRATALAGYRRGPGRGRASRSTSGWSSATGVRPRGRRAAAWTRCSPATPPFTAICCANDLLALGALGRLPSSGIARAGRGVGRGLRRHRRRGDHRTQPCRPSGCTCASWAGAASPRSPRRARRRGRRPRGAADRGRAPRVDRRRTSRRPSAFRYATTEALP